MVDTDNAKSRRELEFRKLNKERSIEELKAPDSKHNHSVNSYGSGQRGKSFCARATSLIPAPSTERSSPSASTSQPPPPPMTTNVHKSDANPNKQPRTTISTAPDPSLPSAQLEQQNPAAPEWPKAVSDQPSLKFPSLFSDDFGPSALLNVTPTLTNTINYGEGLSPPTNSTSDTFSIARPTFELHLDQIFNEVENADTAAVDSRLDKLMATSNMSPRRDSSSLERRR